MLGNMACSLVIEQLVICQGSQRGTSQGRCSQCRESVLLDTVLSRARAQLTAVFVLHLPCVPSEFHWLVSAFTAFIPRTDVTLYSNITSRVLRTYLALFQRP